MRSLPTFERLSDYDPIAVVQRSCCDYIMQTHLIATAKFFSFLALVPLCIGFVGAWSAGLGFLLFLVGIPAAILVMLIGGVKHTISGVNVARLTPDARKRWGSVLIAPIGLVLIVLVSWPLLAAGGFVGSLSRLAINKGHYDAIVAKARKSRKPAWYAVEHGITYSVDIGPPIRVAFNPEGMLDNWSGIIFDPTGDVMLADGFDSRSGKFRAPERVTKLFDGDLVSCGRLWWDYYDCSFT